MKHPIVVIDFTDELARQLSSERATFIVRDYIENQACVETKGAARLLGIANSAFRRLSKKIPCVNLGERTQRYRIKDILAYRDHCTIKPKA